MAEFQAERDDDGLRCWSLELIGHARSPKALPLLVAELDSRDDSLRYWARRGLELLDSKPIRTALWRASTVTPDRNDRS